MTSIIKRPKHTSPNILVNGEYHGQRTGSTPSIIQYDRHNQRHDLRVDSTYPRSIVGAEMRHIEALFRECLQHQYEMRTRRDLRFCTVQNFITGE